MATIGANDLMNKRGNPTDIAVAMIKGELGSYEESYASEVVGRVHMMAAEARIKLEVKPPTLAEAKVMMVAWKKQWPSVAKWMKTLAEATDV